MVHLEPQARAELLVTTPREVYGNTSIPDALDALQEYCRARPDKYVFEIRPRDSTGVAPAPELALGRLLWDVSQWLGLFFYSVLFRAGYFADAVADAFNRRLFVSVAIYTRNLFELFVVTSWYYQEFHRLQADTTSFQGPLNEALRNAVANTEKLRRLLARFARSTRVNWDQPFGDKAKSVEKEIRADIGKMLKAVPDVVRPQALRYYSILSDAVHPNFGQVNFFIDHDSIEGGIQPRIPLLRYPAQQSHLQYTVDIVAVPLGLSSAGLRRFLAMVEKMITHYREGAVRFGSDPSAM
jgi:hypothetical protein